MKIQHSFVLFVVAPMLIATIACGGKPSPEIVGRSAKDGLPGFDYTIWVDCTIRNNGSDGNIEVVAELRGGGFWKKRETVFLARNEEKMVTIAFPEAELLGAGLSGYQYNCSANAK